MNPQEDNVNNIYSSDATDAQPIDSTVTLPIKQNPVPAPNNLTPISNNPTPIQGNSVSKNKKKLVVITSLMILFFITSVAFAFLYFNSKSDSDVVIDETAATKTEDKSSNDCGASVPVNEPFDAKTSPCNITATEAKQLLQERGFGNDAFITATTDIDGNRVYGEDGGGSEGGFFGAESIPIDPDLKSPSYVTLFYRVASGVWNLYIHNGQLIAVYFGKVGEDGGLSGQGGGTLVAENNYIFSYSVSGNVFEKHLLSDLVRDGGEIKRVKQVERITKELLDNWQE